MRSESTESMMPLRRARTTAPESRAVTPSMPVPTIGASRAEQRHGLALHVRAHQSAVRVVVLEERHQRGSDRNQLLRADVDVIDFIAADQDEVAGLAGVDQFGDDAALVIELGVGLRDDVLVFFPSRQIEGERLAFDGTLAAFLQIVVHLHGFAAFRRDRRRGNRCRRHSRR